MGKYVNGTVNNLIAVSTTVVLSALSLLMLLAILLPIFGIPFLS
jgi:hypothetical protein